MTRSSRPRATSARGARVRARLLLTTVALVLVLTACGKEPVSIPTQRMSAADEARCQRLVTALPSTVAGQGRRKTQPAEALGGAWGDPPIIAQCGVGIPQGFSSSASCQQADGVGWFVPDSAINDQSADVVMATSGYRPVLQVTVPATYRPNGLAAVMVQLAPMVKADTRLVHPCH